MPWIFHPESEPEISLGVISPSAAAEEADGSSFQSKVMRASPSPGSVLFSAISSGSDSVRLDAGT